MSLEDLIICPVCEQEMAGECNLCEGLYCLTCEGICCCESETNLITLLASSSAQTPS